MKLCTSNATLVLHPENPGWIPDDLNSVIRLLQQIGLVAEKISGDEQAYLAGEKFLELIAFMGCSPNIRFTPDDNSDCFSFVRLTTTPDTICALTGKHTHAPHCPHCGKPEKDWRNRLTHNTLQCSACEQTAQPWLYNWRKSAGFARFFIEITEIYPKEAIPQPALLAALEAINNAAWKYFYHYP